MRKFLLTIFLFVVMLFQTAYATEVFKIKGLNYDISNSILFLNTSGVYQTSITDGIKLIKQPDTHRVFFDINSSVLLSKKQDLLFSQGDINEIKISQYSTKPNVVRIVMYFSNTFNIDNLKVGNINNNLVITTKDLPTGNAQFYQNTYRDKPQYDDYCEKISVQSKQITPQIQNNYVVVNNQKHTAKELSQIQQAFNNSTLGKTDLVNKTYTLDNISDNLNLKSKYYINSISAKNNGFLINGYGAIAFSKTFSLY